MIRRIIIKVIRRLRTTYYGLFSTLKPIGNPTCYSPVSFYGAGQVRTASDVKFGFVTSPAFLSGYSYIEARYPDAIVQIGKGCHFNNNLSIMAEHGNIIIGEYCLVGANVSIINSDFHPISTIKRKAGNNDHKSKDVIIGNNVFLGNNVFICKGVHIGDNSVIAAGSVVFDDVKANTIVRGNPATFYKKIYE